MPRMGHPAPVGRSISAGRALGSAAYVSPLDRSFLPQKDSHRPSAVNSYARSSFPGRPSAPLIQISVVAHRPTGDGAGPGRSFRFGAPAARARASSSDGIGPSGYFSGLTRRMTQTVTFGPGS